ncbi:DUF2721 domain-containing protein [Gynuella sp.]|uniref:DUF2721 domain-containing protein n=1 Tax=Gynuella sp. TaxID=2969146 RepID=UPI003D0A22AE
MCTPAIRFPMISLFLLAYTNRFLVIADLIKSLYKQYKETAESMIKTRISHLLQCQIPPGRYTLLHKVDAFILSIIIKMQLLRRYSTAKLDRSGVICNRCLMRYTFSFCQDIHVR